DAERGEVPAARAGHDVAGASIPHSDDVLSAHDPDVTVALGKPDRGDAVLRGRGDGAQVTDRVGDVERGAMPGEEPAGGDRGVGADDARPGPDQLRGLRRAQS